ncbi:hypothetical protein BDK51DRAFT_50038 [Blyttiomyces helicus]|uniref:Uncharacterized protein n=1 Tax=Blyttiomyces helicus TaxID=388810 RepID=A0A4P9VVA1_9FUNG|nr:hypothetical protein BDK51DRAFT_50038 [Blyttiomyces helicus]|eukprot:RKO83559.1 hypothetical protein BDK51DRAFT_50038 [Blyttiomyces helicus]
MGARLASSTGLLHRDLPSPCSHGFVALAAVKMQPTEGFMPAAPYHILFFGRLPSCLPRCDWCHITQLKLEKRTCAGQRRVSVFVLRSVAGSFAWGPIASFGSALDLDPQAPPPAAAQPRPAPSSPPFTLAGARSRQTSSPILMRSLQERASETGTRGGRRALLRVCVGAVRFLGVGLSRDHPDHKKSHGHCDIDPATEDIRPSFKTYPIVYPWRHLEPSTQEGRDGWEIHRFRPSTGA